MRMIADEDLDRIKRAREYTDADSVVSVFLDAVLANIHNLGQEQPTPAPRIVQLTPEQYKANYPERG